MPLNACRGECPEGKTAVALAAGGDSPQQHRGRGEGVRHVWYTVPES